jgi:hypothetical protein
MSVELVVLGIGSIVLLAVVFAIVRITVFAYDSEIKMNKLEDTDEAIYRRVRAVESVSSNASRRLDTVAAQVSGISSTSGLTTLAQGLTVGSNATFSGSTLFRAGTSTSVSNSNLMTAFSGTDGKNRIRGDTVVHGDFGAMGSTEMSNVTVDGVALFRRSVNMASLSASNAVLAGSLVTGGSNTFGGSSRFLGAADFDSVLSVTSNATFRNSITVAESLCVGKAPDVACLSFSDVAKIRSTLAATAR